VDKDGDVKNLVGVEVIKLDAVIKKKTMEEIISWEG
jgi:hypothetical protein